MLAPPSSASHIPLFINAPAPKGNAMVSDVLESRDEIVEKLIGSGMSAEEVDAKIREKQEEYGGLLTEAGAAYAIAKDRGIDVGFEPRHEPVKVSDIRGGLEGVDIKGKVTHVFPVKRWEKGERHGKVSSIIVNDGSGEVRVTLWNGDCDIIENGELQRGAEVEIRNAAAKERNGLTELSLGYHSELKVTKRGMPEMVKLSGISEGMNDVNFVARVERIFPLTEFERGGRKGKVLSMIVSDGTERRLVLWDSNADWNGKIREGDTIAVEGAYVKASRGKLELHLGWRGRLTLNPVWATAMPENRKKLSELVPGEAAEIRATVVKVYPPAVYQLCSKTGKKYSEGCDGEAVPAMVVNAELDDGTGVVRGVFFREQAEKLLGFSAKEYEEDSSVFDEKEAAGEEMAFRGVPRHNEMFQRDEFIVRGFRAVDPIQEISMVKGE